MSRSESSLAFVDTTTGKDEPSNSQTNHIDTNASIPSSSSNTQQSQGAMNLSGLVCNVRRTAGKEPPPLVGATTTVLGDKLYVFGGRVVSKTRPRLSSDMYELDLILRYWSKIETTGDIPSPRYFHSVCPLGDCKLVCYGGMSPRTEGESSQESKNGGGGDDDNINEGKPEVMVMSDVHVFDVPSRSWSQVAVNNSPQGRYAHCATILPSNAYFTASRARLSAILRSPESSANDQNSLDFVDAYTDGLGGAEMVVVGGQDESNKYIEQVSVFNLRSQKWTDTSQLDRSCGAYRSVVAPLTGIDVSEIGSTSNDEKAHSTVKQHNSNDRCPILIYSNYNFLDVKLELLVLMPDGQVIEKPAVRKGQTSPPGLRFPHGDVINGHFIVSGTYLTASKQEYALWSLDLRSLTWSRIDAGDSSGGFARGSWNRGFLWPRRSTYVVLGHRRRNLVDDYNYRRINFSHMCMVELEAFGLYNNPCRTSPRSGYVSYSSPPLIAASLQQQKTVKMVLGGRPFTSVPDHLGKLAMSVTELADMELEAVGGERLPVNSRVLSRRWGPYFNQMLWKSAEIATTNMNKLESRQSNMTVRPSLERYSSGAPTLVSNGQSGSPPSVSRSFPKSGMDLPTALNLSPNMRARVLYLPHTYDTLHVLVYYLYTSSLPTAGSSLCTPQILCSLLQIARPYQVDGLLEATVERLHQILDGRNAAAVFNAAAMAAGGGNATSLTEGIKANMLEALNGAANGITETDRLSRFSQADQPEGRSWSITPRRRPLRINTDPSSRSSSKHSESNIEDENYSYSEESMPPSPSTTTSESTGESSVSQSDSEISSTGTILRKKQQQQQQQQRQQDQNLRRRERVKTGNGITGEMWTYGLSSVIGLQKRGLRGLMEGRRLRERGGLGSMENINATTNNSNGVNTGSTGSTTGTSGGPTSAYHQSQSSFGEQTSVLGD